LTGADGNFCTRCWSQLDILPDDGCQLCNQPVALAGSICGPCLDVPPKHDGVLAAVDYCDTARDLALKLKYGRKPGVADVMAALMVRHARKHPDAVLVPIPLHRWRIWQRGFNQSLLIARSVARLTGQEVLPSPILRTKRTSPLGGLSRTARGREVRGAFTMDPAQLGAIKGRHVLLVDDVYTTGATTNACAGVLKRAGAQKVHILCWARVLKEGG
jgi:ComF family protein